MIDFFSGFQFRLFVLKVDKLKSWGYKEISCITKTLMCGDTGIGAMAEVDTIVQATLRCLNPWDPYSPPELRS